MSDEQGDDTTNSSVTLAQGQIENFRRRHARALGMKIVGALESLEEKNEPFNFLDLGCGDGFLGGLVLENFPNARGVFVDSSQYMVDCNTPHPRKEVMLGDVLSLAKDDRVAKNEYRFIIMNVLLHHLVGNSYRDSRRFVDEFLQSIKPLVGKDTVIVVFEQVFNGFVLHNLPAQIIYSLTSINRPQWFVRLVNTLGANTAGVGVAFASEKTWLRTFESNGYKVEINKLLLDDILSLLVRLPLLVKNRHNRLFVLTSTKHPG